MTARVLAEAWQLACEAEQVEPYEREIFEHWSVSKWLGRRLEERGERVGPLDNLTIWGRATTGQAISMDGVIEEIYAALHAPETDAA